jgi:hypothetical protein
MAVGADEQIIESQQSLSILENHLGQGDLADFGLCLHYVYDGFAGLVWRERQQYAVKPRRLGIHGNDRLIAHVFCGVRDQAVLPQRDHEVVLLELKGRDQTAIHQLLG